MIYIEEQGEPLVLVRLTYEEAFNPHTVISNYFDCASLPVHRLGIQELVLSATTEDEESARPLRISWFIIKQTEKLLEAAYLLQRDKSVLETNKAKIKPEKLDGSPMEPALHCRSRAMDRPWDYMPKHLKDDEFINPYVAFDAAFKFATLPGWRKVFSELKEYARMRHSIYDMGGDFDVLQVLSLLHRVIEAAHLIEVRENNRTVGEGTKRSKLVKQKKPVTKK